MAERFDILYRFSTDNGATWTDVSEQVNSLQTNIAQNLCTNTFLSAKDEATFVLPETPLYYPDNTPTPKKQLIDAILGNDQVLVHINERKPSKKVMWDDNNVLWKGKHVVWSWSTRRFTGYVDKSSVSLRSYPLPPNLTVRLQDVSVLHLDDKVDRDVCLEDDPDGTRLHISDIVSALLGYAGYTDIGSLALDAGDDVIIQAFVIDKDKAKTYRQYIDTLLFEAGGYVLDFNEYGQANVVHLKWDGSVGADRTIDNPMNANGVTMRSAYLVNDGAKVKWSTLQWAQNERIWQSNINQKYEDGIMVGDIVHDMGYWPPDGDVSPIFFQYDAKLLDIPYLHRDTRWQNEDLSIIMAKNTRLGVDTLKGTTPFPIEDWDKHDPNSWPVGDTWHDRYGLDSNPQYWPTKMWILLQNKTGEDLNVSLAYIYGDVLYRNRINTIQTDGSKNPKEYVSEYIYDKDQAERFLQFYWHFLQTSRYQFSWSEPNVFDALNSVISVGIKGNSSMQKSLVVGKSSQWLNASTEIVTYVSVGIDAYVPSQMIPTVIAPSSTNNAVPSVKSAVTATFATTPSFTLAQWEDLQTAQQEWTVTNPSSFSAGDVAVINGYISDMDDTPIKLYMNVDSITGSVISGVGIRIEYTPIQYQWDFSMSATEAIRQDRDTVNGIYTDIVCESMELGYGLLPYWKILNGDPSLVYFANNHSQLNTGDKVTVRIWAQNTEDKIVIRMASDNTNNPAYKIEKSIAIKNVTEYNHDFGAWEPTGGFLLPDHITVGGEDYDILDGDFFVAKTTFATASSGTVTAVGTENPRNLGWMERMGSGTSADPYYYVLTTDTSCSAGDTYYTANSGDTYMEGVPYEYIYPAWHNEISATTENADRMLKSLSNVLTNPGLQPSVGALYGWFQNFVALNAVIENLTARLATIENLIITGQLINDAIQTVESSNPTVLGFITSSQNYYNIRGEVLGSCPQLKISDISSVIPVGISYATSGSITIKGTTYTASEAYPIRLYFERFNSGDKYTRLRIYRQNTLLAFFMGYSGPYYAESGYIFLWTNNNVDTSGTVTANSLALPASLGKILVHDVIPRDSSVDTVGTPGNRFHSGAFNSMDISDGGLVYKQRYVTSGNLTIPSGTTAPVTDYIVQDITLCKTCLVQVTNSGSGGEGTAWLPINFYSGDVGRIFHDVVFRAGSFSPASILVAITPTTGQIAATPAASLSGDTTVYFYFYK